ncbi:winged helix-turn-helix transcriptional regulator [Candidatus Woesebacteria bacterium]|nr:MAG: winged helix-turn-helix transcriptional regulator [Candidatus Woesebacteria bacterium]
MSNKVVNYPVTPKTLHEYAESIFAPIRRGENVTTVWVPMAGRRLWNKFIIENIELFEKELPFYKKYCLVYIEPLDLTEESLSGYLRLIALSFIEAIKTSGIGESAENKYEKTFKDENVTYANLLNEIKGMFQNVIQNGFEIVLFLGEFDELNFANKIFFHNLKSLWNRLYPSIHFVFLMREGVVKPISIDKWGDFSEVVLQNVIHIPMLVQQDIDFLIDNVSRGLNIKTTKEERELLSDLCGGHPYMLKVGLRIIANHKEEKLSIDQIEKILLNHYELRSVSRGILNVLDEKETATIFDIASERLILESKSNQLKTLISLGLVYIERDGRLKIFSRLIKNTIGKIDTKKQSEYDVISNGNLILEENKGAISYRGKNVEEKFTSQEYVLINYFLNNKNTLKSRDDIGDVLWGDESCEKYSDWAIDQLISKLRKKLKDMGTTDKLTTIRGRGYKYISYL